MADSMDNTVGRVAYEVAPRVTQASAAFGREGVEEVMRSPCVHVATFAFVTLIFAKVATIFAKGTKLTRAVLLLLLLMSSGLFLHGPKQFESNAVLPMSQQPMLGNGNSFAAIPYTGESACSPHHPLSLSMPRLTPEMRHVDQEWFIDAASEGNVDAVSTFFVMTRFKESIVLSALKEAAAGKHTAVIGEFIDSVLLNRNIGIPSDWNEVSRGQILYPGQNLIEKSYIESPNGLFRLRLQTDGNLVVSAIRDSRFDGCRFHAGTHHRSDNPRSSNRNFVRLESDGELVVYDRHEIALWNSNSRSASYEDDDHEIFLKVSDDGRAIIGDGDPSRPDFTVIWASITKPGHCFQRCSTSEPCVQIKDY